MNDSLSQYRKVLADCKKIFELKSKDYGTAWRILRPSSITDQIFIKANRIRSIQEKGTQKIGDSVSDEFRAIVNYGIMGMIQLNIPDIFPADLTPKESVQAYDHIGADLATLFYRKNHDYGDAWRDMRVSSMTDLILMKLFRIKQIEDNGGKTVASEGVDAGYQDIVNYSLFCLILLSEKNTAENSKKLVA